MEGRPRQGGGTAVRSRVGTHPDGREGCRGLPSPGLSLLSGLRGDDGHDGPERGHRPAARGCVSLEAARLTVVQRPVLS